MLFILLVSFQRVLDWWSITKFICILVRLLKAFQIDFSWYRLSSWINLTEQWPLRASMIVLQHDQIGDAMDDSVSLQSVYEK